MDALRWLGRGFQRVVLWVNFPLNMLDLHRARRHTVPPRPDVRHAP